MAAGDIEAAASATTEMDALAQRFATTALRADAARCAGAVAAAAGDADAVGLLRRAADDYRTLPAPHETATTRLLLADALDAAGDGESAALEREGARRTLDRLGARPDLDTLDRRGTGDTAHGLSRREVEVLTLVASGITNQEIADELSIALRTVDRHVENILRKLDVSSRTAATAAAYELRIL